MSAALPPPASSLKLTILPSHPHALSSTCHPNPNFHSSHAPLPTPTQRNPSHRPLPLPPHPTPIHSNPASPKFASVTEVELAKKRSSENQRNPDQYPDPLPPPLPPSTSLRCL
ncbi:hypothetical protein CRYUN_Cryun41cG0029100 [Craigia yunnanensis]